MAQILEKLTNSEIKNIKKFLTPLLRVGNYELRGIEGVNCICHCDDCHCECYGCVSCDSCYT